MVVQKTGWGKSFVYFIATKLLRQGGSGPALLISPLLELMRNQIAATERMGVRAVTINSDDVDDWTRVEAKIARGGVDILLISPERLAAALDLPFHMVIAKTDGRPEQKTMANSTQQARNIDGSLALNGQPVPHGPVILVDDMVDSRWTLTVAAWLLRQSGSGEVWPMALSQTGHDE
jgi:phosphoribosylpyrophosphate synthetase